MFGNLFERLRQRQKVHVADLPPEQQEIKDEITPTFNLPFSYYGDERNFRKFLVLNDGSVIPVRDEHEGFLARTIGHGGVEQFMKSGGMMGGIGDKIMYLRYDVKPTDTQVDSIVKIFMRYGGDAAIIDGHIESFDSHVKSPEHLRYLITYNEELDECHFDLYEHLIRINENALPEVQQKIKDSNPSGIERLSFAREYETDLIKFLILNDGTIIPVKVGHYETMEGSGASSSEFNKSGGIQGRAMPGEHVSIFNPNKDFGGFTDQQIWSFVRIYHKYRAKELIVHLTSGDHVVPIKSGEQLEAVLQYGPEMAMAERVNEAGLPPEQEELKKRVRPSMHLTPSTWSGEEKWYKFLILNDGSVIPVEKSHRGTIVGRDLVPGPLFSDQEEHYYNTKHAATQRKFYDTGAVEGKFFPAENEMDLYWNNELTDEQIKAAVDLFKKYPVRIIYLNNMSGLGVDSADRFEAILRYGEEMAVAEARSLTIDDEDKDWGRGDIFPSWVFEDPELVPEEDIDLVYDYAYSNDPAVGDVGDALERAVQNSKPSVRSTVLFRTVLLPSQIVDGLLSGESTSIKMERPTSWSASLEGTEKYVKARGFQKFRTSKKNVRVVLEIKVPKGVKGVVIRQWDNIGTEVVLSKNLVVNVDGLEPYKKGYLIKGRALRAG